MRMESGKCERLELTQTEVDVALAAAHDKHVGLVEQWKLRGDHRRVHRHRHEELHSVAMPVERQLGVRHAALRYARRCRKEN